MRNLHSGSMTALACVLGIVVIALMIRVFTGAVIILAGIAIAAIVGGALLVARGFCARTIKATDSCGFGAFAPACGVILWGHGSTSSPRPILLASTSLRRSAVCWKARQRCCHETSSSAIQEMKRRRLRRHRAHSEP